jgi:hypothetical protein
MAITIRTYDKDSTGRIQMVAEKVEHAGKVVSVYSQDERIMSDVWATARKAIVILDGKYQTLDLGLADSDWFCTPYNLGEGKVDASPEELAKYAEYLEECRREELAKQHAAATARYREDREREFHTPGRGKTMQVVKGRKVPVGTIGKVVAIFDGQYGPRALLALTEEKVNGRYTDIAYVPVGYLRNVDPEGPRY